MKIEFYSLGHTVLRVQLKISHFKLSDDAGGQPLIGTVKARKLDVIIYGGHRGQSSTI
jgi:hypothetical protein